MDGPERKGNASDSAVRDLLGAIRAEPIAPSLSPSPPPSAAAPAMKAPKIFVSDVPHGEDVLAIEAALHPLAELALHRDTEAPLTIGLLGAAGSGKSFALTKLLARIDALSGSASHDDAAFVSPIAAVHLDASSISGEPVVALASAIHGVLSASFPELAREAAQAVRDPQAVAREAAEELDSTRRRLDSERQNLAEIESRRARLSETVLFEQAGSQVDAYARANRTKIESRLRGFGISGDAIASYKSMLRDIADSGGSSARFGVALRAFWAFKGQTRLLVLAVILALIGLGCQAAFANQATWFAWLNGVNQAFVPLASWLKAHVDWLPVIQHLAFAGAVLALIANLWRGIRFLRPLFRGASLLEAEVAHRRRDLDGLYAHQMRRVDALVADVELLERRAAEAERRAGSVGAVRFDRRAEISPFETATLKTQAERFIGALGTAIERGWRGGAPMSAAPMPRRIIIGLDNVDRLPRADASDLLDHARRAFGHFDFVTLVAADPMRLAAAATFEPAGDHAALEKWIQVPFRIGGLGGAHYARLVEHALGRPEAAPPQAPDTGAGEAGEALDTAKSRPGPLDWSVSDVELKLLTALAPVAGRSPRAVKRFVNLYRIARATAPQHKPVVAFMLALEHGGSDRDRAAVVQGLESAELASEFMPQPASPDLQTALAAMRVAQAQMNGVPHAEVSVAAARRAAAVARTFSLRL